MGLTLVRHTTPLVDAGICYGRMDLDVAGSFPEEASAVARNLSRPDRIITSPLQRCYRLAEYLSETLHSSLFVDDRLVEMDFGIWEGRPWVDIPREELDIWAADFLHARPHGGESVATLQARVLAALKHHFDPAQSTLVVTHAGVIKVAVSTRKNAANSGLKTEFGGIVHWQPDPVPGDIK